MATRTTIQRTRPLSTMSPDAPAATPVPAARGDRPLQPAHVANARALGSHGCSCIRSPRAIAQWLLAHQQPPVEATDLALDREEAALWSSTLTGRLKIEHTAVDGTCALHLGYADGRSITIAMGELRLAEIAAA